MKISVSQAFLILLDHYYSEKNFSAFDRVKKLYFLGADSEAHLAEINDLFGHPCLQNYIIDKSPEAISEDPTRRYFETQLAYETLVDTIKDLNINDLEKHLEHLFKLAPTIYDLSEEELLRFFDIIFNDKNANLKKYPIAEEMNDALTKIASNDFYIDFSIASQKKLELLIKCSSLTATDLTRKRQLPINIYGIGIFSNEKRGRVSKPDQNTVTSQNFGLMKSYMPVPVNDVAYSASPFSYTRPVDRNNFVYSADWTKESFAYLVYPFSCSVSGSLLSNLRTFKEFASTDQLIFDTTEKLKVFLKCYISLLIYNSGGHSIHEFVYPISMPEVKENFTFMPGFDELNKETLFFHGNEKAFDKAIDKTLIYHRQILNKELMHEELKRFKK